MEYDGAMTWFCATVSTMSRFISFSTWNESKKEYVDRHRAAMRHIDKGMGEIACYCSYSVLRVTVQCTAGAVGVVVRVALCAQGAAAPSRARNGAAEQMGCGRPSTMSGWLRGAVPGVVVEGEIFFSSFSFL